MQDCHRFPHVDEIRVGCMILLFHCVAVRFNEPFQALCDQQARTPGLEGLGRSLPAERFRRFLGKLISSELLSQVWLFAFWELSGCPATEAAAVPAEESEEEPVYSSSA